MSFEYDTGICNKRGHAVVQLVEALRYKSGVRFPMAFFIDVILPAALRPSASNRNEYQECFLGVKAAGG